MVETPKRRRPFGIMVIIILQLVALISLFFDLYILEDQDLSLAGLMPGMPPEMFTYAPAVVVILYQVILIYGLWQLKRWAWLVIMIQLGIAMAISLTTYFYGTPLYLYMFINIIMVFYLNQRDVQRAFERVKISGETT